MIALTDYAVKNMLQTRFNMPAIFSSESVALEERGDIRFQLPTGLITPEGSISPKVKFPFCIWSRNQGSVDDSRLNIAMARDGVEIGMRNEDQTKARFIKLIPITYPYAVGYYVSDISHSVRIEKIYWGLKVDFQLSIYYPPYSDDRLKEIKIYISDLSGFSPAKTDSIYSKGRYFAGSMNFSVSTWIAEGIDIPIVQRILVETYDQNTESQLDSFDYDQRVWRRL